MYRKGICSVYGHYTRIPHLTSKKCTPSILKTKSPSNNNSMPLTTYSRLLLASVCIHHSTTIYSSAFSLARHKMSSFPVLCDENVRKECSIMCHNHLHRKVMSAKAHGTCERPVMDNLRWGCDFKTADNICCFNRHYAEHSGYFETKTNFLSEVDRNSETTFYDSVTGKPLFIAPRGRSFEEFLRV